MVFLVSRTRAGLAASAMARVAVATPLIRCMKFRDRRSATRIDRALPARVPRTWPLDTAAPSSTLHVTFRSGSTVRMTTSATPRPAKVPSALLR